MRLIVALVVALFASHAFALDTDMKSCAVTTASSTCVPQNTARSQLELRNNGATNVAYCSTICPATTANSFPLPVSGANPWKLEGTEIAASKICCITSASTTTVVWREVTRDGLLSAPTPTPIATPTPTP